jgi:hypothetical protein
MGGHSIQRHCQVTSGHRGLPISSSIRSKPRIICHSHMRKNSQQQVTMTCVSAHFRMFWRRWLLRGEQAALKLQWGYGITASLSHFINIAKSSRKNYSPTFLWYDAGRTDISANAPLPKWNAFSDRCLATVQGNRVCDTTWTAHKTTGPTIVLFFRKFAARQWRCKCVPQPLLSNRYWLEKCAAEMDSAATIRRPSMLNIGLGIQKDHEWGYADYSWNGIRDSNCRRKNLSINLLL